MVTHSYIAKKIDTPLLTLAQAKKQCKVSDDLTYEDDLITEYNVSAQFACENYLNRSISKRDFVMEASKFFSPITFERNYENDVITKIEYYAPGATILTLLPSDQYKLRKSNTIECFDIYFVSMPETAERDDAVIITIAQGFDAAACPKPILQAIRLQLSSLYVFREDGNGNNAASLNLLRPYRKF
ncbi:head-tail connector protein [Flavobacterium aquiphilum]|uniref:head-tail connector protein n=1 Tax=Flavobacterium aquiphilum TaxID=3003261 RepID=UPI00248195F3|nr:head-tail connector protein [Flavobacterium aquiphilum]